MKIDALRRKCSDAALKGHRAREEAQETEDGRGKASGLRAKAEEIMGRLPDIVGSASRDGLHHAVVMAVPSSDWDPASDLLGSYEYKPGFLRGLSSAVYDGCGSASLKPALVFWTDGQGASGHNIVIHW